MSGLFWVNDEVNKVEGRMDRRRCYDGIIVRKYFLLGLKRGVSRELIVILLGGVGI
jgi:hypothetical protein